MRVFTFFAAATGIALLAVNGLEWLVPHRGIEGGAQQAIIIAVGAVVVGLLYAVMFGRRG